MSPLTKENLDWLFSEASAMQGCNGPSCDGNREVIKEMRKELADILELHRARKHRDKYLIGQYLRARGLKEIKSK